MKVKRELCAKLCVANVRRHKTTLLIVASVLCGLLVYFINVWSDFSIAIGQYSAHEEGPSPEVLKYMLQLEQETHENTDFMDTSTADDLTKKIRILCLILTTQDTFSTRARAVNATWAKRCNNHFFIIASPTRSLPNIIVTPYQETRENLLMKVKYALGYVYTNLIEEFDWILKADDDSYVIVENLRYLLSSYNSTDPGYLGFHFNNYLRNYGFMSGGAGYLISNRALRRLVEFGFQIPGACPLTKKYYVSETSEDLEIGKCLKVAGVNVLSSIDKFGRETFHPYPINQYLLGTLPEYLLEWSNNKQETGLNCCSHYSISFHYMKPETMLLVDHLLYRTAVFGRNAVGNKTGNDVFRIGHVTNMAKPSIEIHEEYPTTTKHTIDDKTEKYKQR